MKRTDYCLKTPVSAEFVGGDQWPVEIHHQGRQIIEDSILPNNISPLPAAVQKKKVVDQDFEKPQHRNQLYVTGFM